MISYKSQRHNDRGYIFREWIWTTLAISTPLLLDLLLPKLHLVNRSYWYRFIPVYSLINLIGLCMKDRVNEIILDTENRQISFWYYDINEGQVKKSFSFDTLRLEISNSKLSWLFDPIRIYFLQGKKELMSVSKFKDGFSISDLTDLKSKLEVLTSPIK